MTILKNDDDRRFLGPKDKKREKPITQLTIATLNNKKESELVAMNQAVCAESLDVVDFFQAIGGYKVEQSNRVA